MRSQRSNPVDDKNDFWEMSSEFINTYEDEVVFTKEGLIDLFKKMEKEPRYRTLTEDEKGSFNL